ncbi:Crp/Fnr family transcriptional regulator [Flavobacteriaceae bacterium XHP0103]|uniref:Crp/Fnr family transcriptional regulator n=1 Tax=Marixanthotalea marina TaxID=2844359 RepID=UPI002989BF1D|nr:Crp/Fnr family transcriptional regulator [Marixanthotalea marina]MBU3822927.1 Crp/Fnr family transcriptional regulator [Marixanthotalea marina]
METELVHQKFHHVLDDGILKEISEIGLFKHFEKDDIIIDVGQPLKYIPLLLSGSIKILRGDDEGDDLLIYFLEAGETCTMTLACCMGTTKSKIRAVAEKNSDLVMIPVEYMQKWFHTNESWRNFILESYQTRFTEMLETIDTLAFMKMDERLLKYLKNKVILHDNHTLDTKHQDIAEDLHTSRVVVSRLLKQLENENKIKISRNKIEVLV